MSVPLMPCGTYAAHQRHKMHDEEPCRACKDACNEYRRQLRGRGIATTDPITENARRRAQVRLVKAFPDAFRPLFEEEIARGTAAARADA